MSAISMINYNFGDCLNDKILANQVKSFKSTYNEIRYMSDEDLRILESHDFKEALPIICETKRKLASTITDCISHIANECVKDLKMRKKFKLNTLLMVQSMLDFMCSLDESVFNDIFQHGVMACFRRKRSELDECRKNSFKLLFFERAPQKLFWISMINGSVCK